MGDDGRVSARILVVDNYDSFVFNIVQYLAQLGAEVDVRRNDEVTPDDARGYDGVLLSPGPGTPADAGVCIEMIEALGGVLPIFGVCLGHQAIGEAYGASVVRAPGAAARQDEPGAPPRRRRARRPARPVHRHPLPLARDRPGHRARPSSR